MTSRLANARRCSFLYMTVGRSVLGSMLVALIVTGAAGAHSAPAVSPAEARTAIQAGYAEWAKASVALDMNTIERMLAPDFHLTLPDRTLTRQEFIDSMHSLKITRFDATVLTVEPRDNDWSAFIFKKVEVETRDKEGKASKGYRLLVARDGWRQLNANHWTLLSSELLGQQRWTEERPPIAYW